MTELEGLSHENAELRLRLAQADATLQALLSGEVDAVAIQAGSTPLLLSAAQEQLRERELVLRAIFDGALDPMLLADETGAYISANPAACALFGLSRDEILGRRIEEFAAPGAALPDPRLPGGGPARGSFRFLRPDGGSRELDFSAASHIVPGLHLSVLSDVTERRAAEVALRETRYFLEAAQEVAQVGGWSRSLEREWDVAWTPQAYGIFGLPPDSIHTRDDFLRMIHPDDRASLAANFARAVAEGSIYQDEYRVVRPDGEVRWIFVRGGIERSPAGAPLRIVGVVQDITERRRALDRLRASEERYRQIVETTFEGVWVIDGDEVTTFVNARIADLLGYTSEEMVGRSALCFMDDEARLRARARLAARRRGLSEQYENRYLRKDGSAVWLLVKANPITDESGSYLGAVGLFTDITAQRTATEARNRLAAIVEGSDDGIASKSLTGVITSWNRGAEKLFGYSAVEAIGSTLPGWVPEDHAGDGERIAAALAAGASSQFDTARRRKDGSRVEVSLLVSPIRDADGQMIGTSRIFRDLTARRAAEAELRRTEEQLRQAQKMEAIGSLAGGVAHDFNNLLSVILSYTALILEELRADDPVRADVAEIDHAGHRAADLTRQLLAFSRQQVLAARVLDVNGVLRGIERMLLRILGEDVVLRLLTAPVGKIFADPGQIEQVVLNLVVNARDAMPRGGQLTIETRNVALDGGELACPGVPPGSYVLLAVADTGTGMDAATLHRVFEPFFTTKESGKGTGLGLSTCYGIVKQSGGHIRVVSAPGHGTTFSVYLPCTDRPERESANSPSITSARGDETILLVEDEDQVRVVNQAILRRLGYNVLDAQNAGEALLISDQFRGRIDLLLTDVVMPRMSGRDLAERLLPGRPEMRILYVSGYTRDTSLLHEIVESGVGFLQKPVTPDRLGRKVREVLDLAPP